MANLKQRGKSWQLSWSEGGRQYRRSLGSIAASEAEKIRSAKEAELAHGVRIIAKLPTLRDFMTAYTEWYVASHPTTQAKFRSEIKQLLERFGHRQIDSIRPTEIEQWKSERLKVRARETVGKELRRFRAALNCGLQWDEIDCNPFAKVSAPRGARSVAVKFYTAAQVRTLYRKAERGPLWMLLACTGMRRGEAVKVQRSRDVVRVGKQWRLRIESTPDETGEGRTKSGKWREVPLNARALEALKALPDRIADCHPDTLSDWFAADAKALKLGGSLHRLRHTFCAHLVMAGVPLRRVQLLAGHADYKTTEMYAHLAPEGAKGAVDKLKF
ncbi:tyrosine-type recombinase/integrase [Lysobacter antibioticus]|uniref:tyrosine-type recombinase/integrase n=1 Tax=Lysobacter antibioticus TaxID=84531 RepID=UPI0007E8D01C|nr:tyrosine-type recombinase/integrase [Lysobacter antibioticus]